MPDHLRPRMCEDLDCKSYFSCLKFINQMNMLHFFCLLQFNMFPKSKLLSHLNFVVQIPFGSASQIGKFNKPISKIRKRKTKCNKNPKSKSYKLKLIIPQCAHNMYQQSATITSYCTQILNQQQIFGKKKKKKMSTCLMTKEPAGPTTM